MEFRFSSLSLSLSRFVFLGNRGGGFQLRWQSKAVPSLPPTGGAGGRMLQRKGRDSARRRRRWQCKKKRNCFFVFMDAREGRGILHVQPPSYPLRSSVVALSACPWAASVDTPSLSAACGDCGASAPAAAMTCFADANVSSATILAAAF